MENISFNVMKNCHQFDVTLLLCLTVSIISLFLKTLQ